MRYALELLQTYTVTVVLRFRNDCYVLIYFTKALVLLYLHSQEGDNDENK
jgi:hypothetical protein